MNKILNILLAVVLVALSSCREDADIPSAGTPINVVEEAQGTYSGTWTITKGDNKDLVGEYAGSITIAPYSADHFYACYLTVDCPDYSGLNGTGAANLVKQSRAYRFYNEIATNPLGSVFSGSITFEGDVTMSFSKVLRDGRKTTQFYFSFVGKK